jgi:diaminohydroxyphosphoribosylaminopyrimidine deaminase/5-amino-6-(5-phosphoribosylamino)uracil reductase
MTADEGFMREALNLAVEGWGRTHPNPMVGAVIVEKGKVVAAGFHAKDGGPHAERVALEGLGRAPKAGAVLYVTLEPCSTEGRTGACTRAIIASGIKRVVVGATDPFPAHQGRGFAVLRGAGIGVVTGVLERECTDLNLIFNHWAAKNSPLLAAKAAVTLDGRIACRTGESQWITGEVARGDVHRWRRLFPAIAVGAGTVAKDNPRLTARLPGEAEWCPIRFVFDGRLRTVDDRNMPRLYTDEFHERTIVVTTQHGGLGYVRKLKSMGVQVWIFDSATQRAPLEDFRRQCAESGIAGVFFEGGQELVSECARVRQLDYFFTYCAPMFMADERAKPMLSGFRTEHLQQALRLTDVRHEVLGPDILVRGRLAYPEKLQIDETKIGLE